MTFLKHDLTKENVESITIREAKKKVENSQMADYPIKTIQLVNENTCTIETRGSQTKEALLQSLSHYANAAGVDGSEPLNFFLVGKETETQVTFYGDINNLMQALQLFELSSKETTQQATIALETLKSAEQSNFEVGHAVSGIACK